MTGSILNREQGNAPPSSPGVGFFCRLAVSDWPGRALASYRPAAKNVYTVSFIPLRLEVLGLFWFEGGKMCV